MRGVVLHSQLREVVRATVEPTTSIMGSGVLLSCCAATQLGAVVWGNGPERCYESTASSLLQL